MDESESDWLRELANHVRGATVTDVRMHEHYAGNCGEEFPGVWYGDVWVRWFYLCLNNGKTLRLETFAESPWPRVVDPSELSDTVTIADEVPILGKRIEALGIGHHDRFLVVLEGVVLVSIYAQADGDWIDHGEQRAYDPEPRILRKV